MRRILTPLILFLTIMGITPVFAAAGISASGGGTKTVGQQFTITVTASGGTFDSLQGTISVSGPVSVVSFSPGGATWLPGKTPSNGGQFVGITSATSSLTVARITLKGTQAGTGSVSVSGVKLASNGSIVGTGGGSSAFTIQRALTPPGTVNVTSTSHPDQNQPYEATTIDLNWEKANGVTEFSYLLDQTPDTTPPAKKTSSDTSAKYENQAVGTYYFHIRAKNGDGWGGATHFKVTIKEPDPKIDETLEKPVITKITKIDKYQTDLEAGTISGLVISGKGFPGYKINLTPTPAITLPEGTSLSSDISPDGDWQVTINAPIKSGFYKLTAQGQKEKILTPVSDPVKFEITLAKGGDVRIITDKDAVAKTSAAPATASSQPQESAVLSYAKKPLAWILLLLLLGSITSYFFLARRSRLH